MKKLFLAMAVAIVTGTAVSAQDSNKEDKIVVSTHQTDKADGYEGDSANRCGIKFNFRLTGVTKVELESVDGLPLAGAATICKDVQGKAAIGDMAHTSTIITYSSSDKSGFIPGKDYYISTLPCDLYEDTGSPFIGTDLWPIISVCIRKWIWENLSVPMIWWKANWSLTSPVPTRGRRAPQNGFQDT